VTDSNYKGLEKLYRQYKSKGFTVIAFPCNQFKNQEPGTNAEIKEFAKKKYGVTFPMMSKVDVNGPTAHPIWKFLKEAKPVVVSAAKERDIVADGSADITWNFNKFLVDGSGRPIKRYPPPMDKDISSHIERDVKGLLGMARTSKYE